MHWVNQSIHDPGVTFIDLLGLLYTEERYNLEFSPDSYDFVRSHHFTGGELKRLAMDSVEEATKKGEPLKIEHV